jgi:hypothetical protein
MITQSLVQNIKASKKNAKVRMNTKDGWNLDPIEPLWEHRYLDYQLTMPRSRRDYEKKTQW